MRRCSCIRIISFGAWLAVAILPYTTLAEVSYPNNPAVRVEIGLLTDPSGSGLSPESQGDLLMAHGEYAAAIQAYQRISLRSAISWNKIGIAYHHLFALEEARKNYLMALSLNPRYAEALNNLGAVYHGQHSYGKAEKIYKKALRYAPDSAVTYRNLGTTYFADGKEKPGTLAYEKALALDPTVFTPNQNQPIEEITSRRQRVAISYYMAKVYAMAGNNEQALSYLRKALHEGFNDRRHLMQDKEFVKLRTTPEFQQFIVEQHLD